jgi:hypothetical protein
MLDGIARKFALPFVLLSAIGWVLFAVGFGVRNFRENEITGRPAIDIMYFPYWLFGVTALLQYAISITHLFCGNPVTVFIIMFFQAFYFISSGIVMYINGDYIRVKWSANEQELLNSSEYFWILEFSGAIVAVIFLVSRFIKV